MRPAQRIEGTSGRRAALFRVQHTRSLPVGLGCGGKGAWPSSTAAAAAAAGGPGPAAGAAADAQQQPQEAKIGRMNKLLQNVNLAGTSLFFQILGGNQGLALPHVSVPDISWVDWPGLSAAGFRLVLFDKDNTLCEPFALSVPPRLAPAFGACRAAFGSRVALYSNSAGLRQYDPAGAEADALEAAFGVAVARHSDKKPAGSADELAAAFGCEPHEMVFVGDRYLTDVVFGNRHGMLTIRVSPLTSKGEPPTVAAARLVEEACVKRWAAAGIKAPAQRLLDGPATARLVLAAPLLDAPSGDGGGSSGTAE